MINNNNNKETTMQNDKKTLDQQFSEKTGIDVSKKERGVNLDPVIGMGITRSIGSDSYPFTIVDILKVKDKTILKLQGDRDLYTFNPDNKFEYAEQFRNHGLDGRIEYRTILWNEKTKRWNKDRYDYYFYSIGQRKYYLDPSL